MMFVVTINEALEVQKLKTAFLLGKKNMQFSGHKGIVQFT